MYTIEKNVPLPQKGKGVETKTNEFRKVLEVMEVGDSFIIPNKDYMLFGNAKKFMRSDKCFTARKANEKEYRIFRTK